MEEVQTGFVALLDVLGFAALVAGDTEDGQKLQGYLQCLQEAFASDSSGLEVDYVVFSDSIVITTKEDTEKSLLALLARCSKVFWLMLERKIPIRGAIAHGSYLRSPDSKAGVFVAGKAIIDAYNFETRQNWIGIMLAPSVIKRVPDIANRCTIPVYNNPDLQQQLRERLAWAAYVQPCHAIPFHATSPFENNDYDGLSIVPTSDMLTPTSVRDAVKRSVKALEWLKSLAPGPSEQAKYGSSITWLRKIRQDWEGVLSWWGSGENR